MGFFRSPFFDSLALVLCIQHIFHLPYLALNGNSKSNPSPIYEVGKVITNAGVVPSKMQALCRYPQQVREQQPPPGTITLRNLVEILTNLYTHQGQPRGGGKEGDYHTNAQFEDWNWKGAWKKALSDFWSIAILSFQTTLYLVEKIRENLTLQKDSLRTLLHAPPFNCTISQSKYVSSVARHVKCCLMKWTTTCVHWNLFYQGEAPLGLVFSTWDNKVCCIFCWHG